MSNDYSPKEIQLAKKLLSQMDYIPALHEFMRQTNMSMSHRKADILLKAIQKGEIQ